MSRPIDADALKDAIVEKGQRNRRYKLSETWELNRDEIWDVINAQPTIELERKAGQWTEISPFEDCRYVKCNRCNITQVLYFGKPNPNYCPSCGADMRG